MKKLFCFLAVAATAAFTSCSSDDDSGNNGENPGTGNEVTAITLSASATSVDLGTAVTFTVVDQDGDAVTNATLTANGNAITSPWTAETAGEYTVVATLGELTSSVTVTVTEEDTTPVASDSFVIDDTNYETNVGAFAYRGIYAAETEGEYVIVWDFNPYLVVGTGEEATFPNDLYITLQFPITPTGENEAGEPTFTITNPTTGEFTLDTNILDAWIIANSEALLPTDATERAAAISDITLNITALQFAETEGGSSNLEATYTITLTNGTVINGEYSGETGMYDGTNQGRGISIKNTTVAKSQNLRK
ncbi:hypothetical protein [Flavobacterium beibuense]|uniref:Big-1 domain-containing protein n=1 Tax=Flavobacterium beibuense TaxID=657326 RepID=A0A444W8B1_9FLAO|nr:hypothetical protein [Flavobacterium beibuense]RYJ42023.1 hypothetical protein NU09_2427 [Flavobacterium beibuense]